MTLLRRAKKAACQTTILSGDVHVAAHGRIVSESPDHRRDYQTVATIHQLTSSAIGHPEPSFFQWLGIQAFTTDDPEVVADGVHTLSISILPGERYVRSRNFMTLAFDDDSDREVLSMWAQWYTEKYDRLSKQVVIEAR